MSMRSCITLVGFNGEDCIACIWVNQNVFDDILSWICYWILGLYSISGRTSYRKISSSLEAAWLGVIMVGKVWIWISRHWDFTRSCGKESVRLVNTGPVYLVMFCFDWHLRIYFNSLRPNDAYTYIYQWTGSSLVQVMACHLFSAKP